MLFLLAITVVGILVIPIALVTLFCAVVFGKTTVLGWIGNRCFGIRSNHAAAHPALAVIVGGLLVMLVYLVPIVGFVVFILLGMIGYGAVLYALINRIRHSTAGSRAPPIAPAAPQRTRTPPPPPRSNPQQQRPTLHPRTRPIPDWRRAPRRRFPCPRCRARPSGSAWAHCSLMRSSSGQSFDCCCNFPRKGLPACVCWDWPSMAP